MNITKHSQAFAIFMIVWFPISILYLHAVGGGQDDLFLAFCLFIVLWVLGQDRDQSKQNGERKGIKIENLLFSLFLFFVERIIALICRYIVQADPTYHEDTARMEVPMIALSAKSLDLVVDTFNFRGGYIIGGVSNDPFEMIAQ